MPVALLPSEKIYPWSSCLPDVCIHMYIYIYIYTDTHKVTSAPVWMPLGSHLVTTRRKAPLKLHPSPLMCAYTCIYVYIHTIYIHIYTTEASPPLRAAPNLSHVRGNKDVSTDSVVVTLEQLLTDTPHPTALCSPPSETGAFSEGKKSLKGGQKSSYSAQP